MAGERSWFDYKQAVALALWHAVSPAIPFAWVNHGKDFGVAIQSATAYEYYRRLWEKAGKPMDEGA